MSDANKANQSLGMGWSYWALIALMLVNLLVNWRSRQTREELSNRTAALERIGMMQQALMFDARATTQPTAFDERQLLKLRNRLEDRPHEKPEVQQVALDTIDATLAHVREWGRPVKALVTPEAVVVVPDGSVERAPR